MLPLVPSVQPVTINAEQMSTNSIALPGYELSVRDRDGMGGGGRNEGGGGQREGVREKRMEDYTGALI